MSTRKQKSGAQKRALQQQAALEAKKMKESDVFSIKICKYRR